MDNRKWEADAAAVPPGAPASPSDGYPTNGNALTATPATEPGEWWFHAVGEELRAVVVDGGLTPNINTLTQVRDAIRNMIKGGDYKDSVKFTTTANINLTGLGTQAGGDWPGALTAGDRVLVKNNTTGAENGIYNAAAGAWARSSDADTGAELNGGAIIPVEAGTVNADTNWQLTTDGTIVIGTTGLAFASVGGQNFASNAEAQALAITNKAISPSTLNQALKGTNQSLTTNGYQKLPGGLILQWGELNEPVNGANVITLPVAFLTAGLQGYCTPNNADGETAGVQSISTTQITLFRDPLGSGTMLRWLAFGY